MRGDNYSMLQSVALSVLAFIVASGIVVQKQRITDWEVK